MKKSVKHLFSCLVVIVLSGTLIFKLGNLVRPLNTDKAIKSIQTFHSLPENTVEVIGYGSSHMWKGLDPRVLYKNYGIGAYNYGCNWQHINTTRLFIADSLKTQSPKVALIEIYRVNKLLEDTDMNGEIYYTRGLSASEEKSQYLHQVFGDDKERYLSYYVPLCAFHDNWVNLKEGNFMKNKVTKNIYATMGYNSTTKTKPVIIDESVAKKQKKLSGDAIQVLDEMIRVCKQNGVEIIFYTTPWQGKFAYSDAMKQYAQENGCTYLNLFDYIDEMGLDGNTDFCDKGHLNDSGAAKVSDFLGEYIVKHYNVTDMRNVENNIWERYFE